MVALEIETNQAGQRLDKCLGKYLPQAPVSFLYKMLRKKNIELNGKKAEGREILQPGDRVTLWLADETILKFGGYIPKNDGNVCSDAPAGEEIYLRAYRELQDVSVHYEDEHCGCSSPRSATGWTAIPAVWCCAADPCPAARR